MSSGKEIKNKGVYFDEDVSDRLIKRIESRTEKEKSENQDEIGKSLKSAKLKKLNYFDIQNILLSEINYKSYHNAIYK